MADSSRSQSIKHSRLAALSLALSSALFFSSNIFAEPSDLEGIDVEYSRDSEAMDLLAFMEDTLAATSESNQDSWSVDVDRSVRERTLDAKSKRSLAAVGSATLTSSTSRWSKPERASLFEALSYIASAQTPEDCPSETLNSTLQLSLEEPEVGHTCLFATLTIEGPDHLPRSDKQMIPLPIDIAEKSIQMLSEGPATSLTLTMVQLRALFSELTSESELSKKIVRSARNLILLEDYELEERGLTRPSPKAVLQACFWALYYDKKLDLTTHRIDPSAFEGAVLVYPPDKIRPGDRFATVEFSDEGSILASLGLANTSNVEFFEVGDGEQDLQSLDDVMERIKSHLAEGRG